MKDLWKVKVKWSLLRHVCFRPQASGDDVQMLYKYALDTPFAAITVGQKPRTTRNQAMIIPQPKLGFIKPIPVSKALKKDFLDLCKKGAIDSAYHSFYKNL